MNKAMPVIIVVALLAVAGFFLLSQSKAPSDIYEAPDISEAPIEESSLSVTLNEQNNSGETGVATLTEQNGKLVITLQMAGAPAGITQPAHIHTGTCAEIGGVVWGLEFPLDGASETTLATSLSDLAGQMPLAINVHKSATESSVYVSCGDLVL